MGVSKVFIFSFLLFPLVYPLNDCPPSMCGNHGLTIRFPFRLQNQQQPHCGYPGFELRCNNQGKTILTLPYSGDFFIRSINYLAQVVHLYDPYNCLPKRLLNFSLSGSPFLATYYINYTFLRCPTDMTRSLDPIECLSNSTNTTLATTSMSLASSMTICNVIVSLPIPVSLPVEDDEFLTSDLNDDISLTWDIPNCEDCEANGGLCGFENSTSQETSCFFNPGTGNTRGLQTFKIIALCIAIPAIACAIGIAFFIFFMDRRRRRGRINMAQQNITPGRETPEATIVPPGLDESTIESYTKVVVGESRRLPGHNDITCSICLSDYHAKETLRCIPECQHCFHADCIDEWLRMNATCPICRNSPPARINS